MYESPRLQQRPDCPMTRILAVAYLEPPAASPRISPLQGRACREGEFFDQEEGYSTITRYFLIYFERARRACERNEYFDQRNTNIAKIYDSRSYKNATGELLPLMILELRRLIPLKFSSSIKDLPSLAADWTSGRSQLFQIASNPDLQYYRGKQKHCCILQSLLGLHRYPVVEVESSKNMHQSLTSLSEVVTTSDLPRHVRRHREPGSHWQQSD